MDSDTPIILRAIEAKHSFADVIKLLEQDSTDLVLVANYVTKRWLEASAERDAAERELVEIAALLGTTRDNNGNGLGFCVSALMGSNDLHAKKVRWLERELKRQKENK